MGGKITMCIGVKRKNKNKFNTNINKFNININKFNINTNIDIGKKGCYYLISKQIYKEGGESNAQKLVRENLWQ